MESNLSMKSNLSMESSKSEVDYVVFFGADRSAYFANKVDRYHEGMEVYCTVQDIKEAQKICDRLNRTQQTESMSSEQAQKYPTWVHAFFGDIVDTLSTVDKYEFPEVPYILEFFKRIVPVGNAGLYQDSNLLITVITPMESSIQLKIVNRDIRIIFEYEQYLAPYILVREKYEHPNVRMEPVPAECSVKWAFTQSWGTLPEMHSDVLPGWIHLLFDIYRAYINIR